MEYAQGGVKGRYYDGEFQGESDRMDYGYAVALVVLKDDKINDVKLKEIDAEGEWKDFDTIKYEPLVHAHEEMVDRFIETNSIQVGMYTEATQSSIRYKEAVKRALQHARKNPEMEID